MATWSPLPFGNDDAADWAYELEDPNDLAPIQAAIDGVVGLGDAAYLEAFEGAAAVAAVEMLACLHGRPGDTETYTEAADAWLTATTVAPPPDLLAQAQAALARVLAERSELRELWQQNEDYEAWVAALADLRARVAA